MENKSNTILETPTAKNYNSEAIMAVLSIEFLDFAAIRMDFLEDILSDFRADLAEVQTAYEICENDDIRKEIDEIENTVLDVIQVQQEIISYFKFKNITYRNYC
ncbi:MAG: hypothetical protein LUH47_00485 [Clostridiales bacterium]|nr:hypothetical protein [Clostridiales bacterium]